jgi:muramidase (phage lysozyme)
MLRNLYVAHPVLIGMVMRHALMFLMATVVAGCIVGTDEVEVGDSSGNENELAVNEVVQEGEVLRVIASNLNLRASGSTTATILKTIPEGALVTAITESGTTGWVNVTTNTGDEGWVFGRYVVRDSATANEPTGGSCAPSRADNVISRPQQALHDSIAFAEGTRNFSSDGYNVMFSFRLMNGCSSHPNQCISFGGSCSTAAGRYQFQTATRSTVKRARNLGSFEPENQERGAAYLISTTRRVAVPQDRAMTASEFSNAMSKLSYEWASLPPGRYGQPSKTASQMRSTYCSIAGC